MKRGLKQLISFILLFCMLLHSSGIYFTFYFHKQQIRQEMKSYIAKHLGFGRVTRFAFSPAAANELEWEGDDEFAFHKTMYDVIKKEIHSDSSVFYCVQDEKETALVNDFLQHVKKQSPAKDKSADHASLLTWHYINDSKIGIDALFVPPVLHYLHCICSLLNNSADIPKPPPRMIS